VGEGFVTSMSLSCYQMSMIYYDQLASDNIIQDRSQKRRYLLMHYFRIRTYFLYTKIHCGPTVMIGKRFILKPRSVQPSDKCSGHKTRQIYRLIPLPTYI